MLLPGRLGIKTPLSKCRNISPQALISALGYLLPIIKNAGLSAQSMEESNVLKLKIYLTRRKL
jgi:hypothetical protein